MPDEPGQAATGRDSRYSLTIDEAAERYAKAGHPRTLRTIQRYCASGHLDAIKVATALGDKYLVDPTSLNRHVAQIEELARLDLRPNGRDASRPTAAPVVPADMGDEPRHNGATDTDVTPPVAPTPSNSPANANADEPRQHATVGDATANASRPVATVEPDTPRYVAGLEREVERALEDREFLKEQIKVKDEQIAALLERDRETNILVRGLQQMLSPLLGAPRHDDRPPFH